MGINLKKYSHTNRGFTIVELIIVIIVIAILATIVTLSYRGITDHANDVAVQSDLSSFSDAITGADLFSHLEGDFTSELLSSLKWSASQQSYMTESVSSNLFFCRNTSFGVKYWGLIALSVSGKIYYVTQDVNSPKEWTDSPKPQFQGDETCTVFSQKIGDVYNTNYRGYARDDLVNGPWRDWATGGNS